MRGCVSSRVSGKVLSVKTDSTRAIEVCGPQKYEDSFSQSTSPHVYFFLTNAFFKKKLINLAAPGLSCGG